MDERKEQLQVGAGLQESRLNTDLIDFLKKWYAPVVIFICVIVLGYRGMLWLQDYRDGQIDSAFSAYEAARGTTSADRILTGNPDNLVLVANEHDGKASIWELAKLDAGEIWLGSAWRGLRTGVDLQGILDEDILTEEQIAEYLTKARGEFERVLERVRGDDDLRTFELRALDGLSAVAMSEGHREEARGYLEQLAERAGTDFERVASIAQLTIENMDSIPQNVGIIAEADIPASANAPIPVDAQMPRANPLEPGFDPSLLLRPNEPEEEQAEELSDDGTDG